MEYRLKDRIAVVTGGSSGIGFARHIPLGRIGQLEEAAQALVFLASPLASFITGAALDVSGGQAEHV